MFWDFTQFKENFSCHPLTFTWHPSFTNVFTIIPSHLKNTTSIIHFSFFWRFWEKNEIYIAFFESYPDIYKSFFVNIMLLTDNLGFIPIFFRKKRCIFIDIYKMSGKISYFTCMYVCVFEKSGNQHAFLQKKWFFL